jgi:hypothetical protein
MARDPTRAPTLAIDAANIARTAELAGGDVPEGYIYSGAHTIELSADNVAVEPLSPEVDGGLSPTQTGNREISVKAPFDCLMMGLAGWAEIVSVGEDGEVETITVAQIIRDNLRSNRTVADRRDMFAVELGIDGTTWLCTDGNDRLLWPATCVVGSRLSPRPLAWTVRRNQKLNMRVRNLSNLASAHDEELEDEVPPPRLNIRVAYYALNLEPP